MAVHFQRCLRVLMLIVAISAVSSAPQQKQTQAQKQAVVSGPTGDGGGGGQARVQDPKCLQPKEPGPCRMNLERYYYNAQTNTCEKFKFGGCRGNDNKFGFLKTCEDACLIPKTATNNAAGSNAKAPVPAPAPVPAAVPPAASAAAVAKNPKPAAITTNTNAKKTPTAAHTK